MKTLKLVSDELVLLTQSFIFRLAIAFSLIILLMAGGIWVGNFSLNQLLNQSNQLATLQDTQSHLQEVRIALLEKTVGVSQLVLLNQYQMLFEYTSKDKDKLEEVLGEYELLSHDQPAQAEFIAKLRQLQALYNQQIDQMAKQLQQGNSREASAILQLEFTEVANQFQQTLSAKIAQLTPQVTNQKQNVSETSRSSQSYLIIGGVGVALVAIVLAMGLAIRIGRRVAVLKWAVTELGRGNFNTQIKNPPQDELGRVAMAFNQMSRQLVTLIERTEQLYEAERISHQEAEATKQHLNSILESISDAFFVVDRQDCLLYLNAAAERLFQQPREALLGQNIWEQLTATNKLSFARPHDKMVWEQFFSATNTWFEVRAYPYTAGLSIYYRDISERKQAEQALRKSEERFAKSFKAAPLPSIITTLKDGLCLEINDSFSRVMGYRREEVLGHPASEILWNNPQDRVWVIELLQNQGYLRNLEVKFRTKFGQTLEVLLNTELIELDGAECCLSTYLNLTEQKRTQQVLQQTQTRLQAVITYAPLMLFALDLSGVFTLSEGRGLERLGLQPAEIVGQSVFELYPNAPQLLDFVKRGLAGESVNQTLELAGHFFNFSCLPLYEEVEVLKLKGMIGVAVDITELVQAQEALRRSEEALRQAQKMEAIGRLAGGVAHDFNNLLTGILGYAELIGTALYQDDPLQADIEEIKKGAERAGALTRQLLAFSRKQMLQPKVLNLNQIVENMSRLLERLIGEDIELVTLLDPHLGQVKADPGQLEQVVMNLAVNARDAMPGGGKLLLQTTNLVLAQPYFAEHSQVEAGEYVVLTICDSGMGMAAATQARIFEPFFTTKEVGKGTGLGLATVYGIVKQSGGQIEVCSEIGQGTTFKIYLPRFKAPITESQILEKAHAPRLTSSGETVLVVEDEEGVRQLSCRILRQGGYKVLEARGGEEALALIQEYEGSIQLVLTDVIMPGMSGPQLVRHLQELKPELKVLYMSGYTDRALSQHDLLSSGAYLLEKPFAPARLLSKVQEVLEGNVKNEPL